MDGNGRSSSITGSADPLALRRAGSNRHSDQKSPLEPISLRNARSASDQGMTMRRACDLPDKLAQVRAGTAPPPGQGWASAPIPKGGSDNGLARENERLRTQLADANAHTARLSETLATLRSNQLLAVEAATLPLQIEIDDLRRKIDDPTTKVVPATSDTGTSSGSAVRISELEAALATAHEERDAASSQARAFSEEIDEQRRRKEEQETVLVSLRAELEEVRSQHTLSEKRVLGLEAAVLKAEQVFDELRLKVSAEEAERATADQRRSQVLGSLRSRLASVEVMHMNAESELARLRAPQPDGTPTILAAIEKTGIDTEKLLRSILEELRTLRDPRPIETSEKPATDSETVLQLTAEPDFQTPPETWQEKVILLMRLDTEPGKPRYSSDELIKRLDPWGSNRNAKRVVLSNMRLIYRTFEIKQIRAMSGGLYAAVSAANKKRHASK